MTAALCLQTLQRCARQFSEASGKHLCRWDWEVAIAPQQRTLEFLKETVQKLYRIIKDCEAMVCKKWPALQPTLPATCHFVTSEELHTLWPEQGIHGREDKAVEKWGAVFILGMGWPMQDGSAPEEVRVGSPPRGPSSATPPFLQELLSAAFSAHELRYSLISMSLRILTEGTRFGMHVQVRAPDYDDWLLNGDIIVRHPHTGYRHELSSMGIRVDAGALEKQLAHRGMSGRLNLDYHKAIMDGKLPLCMGGGGVNF